MSKKHAAPAAPSGREWPVGLLAGMAALMVASNALTWYAGRREAALAREQAASGARAAAAAPLPAAGPDYAGRFQIVNGHDHLYREQDLGKYLEAAAKQDVVQTVFVASSEFTIKGDSGDPRKWNDENTREILRCAEKHPGKIVPFCSLHPDDAGKVERLAEYQSLGVRGLKLYTGHSNFYDRPLDAPEMMPVYAWCEQQQFPIIWHVNLDKYLDEFLKVMETFPRLRVLVPHFGVTFWRPGGPNWKQLDGILDAYPNVYLDSSFGTREILVGGLQRVDQAPEVFRAVFEKYPGRIVWGTDMVVTGNEEKTAAWCESVIRACRDMLEKPEYHFWMAAKGCKYAGANANNPYGKLRGLALPPDLLEQVYQTNIRKFLGDAPPA